jgi:hypothetical protein
MWIPESGFQRPIVAYLVFLPTLPTLPTRFLIIPKKNRIKVKKEIKE